jgi:hypothetical protein
LEPIAKEFKRIINELNTIQAVYEQEERKPFSKQYGISIYLANFVRATYKALLKAPDFMEFCDYKFGPNSYNNSEYYRAISISDEVSNLQKIIVPKLIQIYNDPNRVPSVVKHFKGAYEQPIANLILIWETKIKSIDEMNWFVELPIRFS